MLRTAYLPVNMVITPPPSLTVRIALFEYGCCRTPPAVGETVTGTLFAHPTASDRSPVRVTGWDRDRDLVTVDGGVARWEPTRGNPFDQTVGIWLSWHSDGLPGVEATATITRVGQIYLGTTADPGGETVRPAERVERFPEPLITPAGAFEPGGAVVTLTDLVLVEPTPQQITDYRAELEIARRTLHITAPPTYFGPTVAHRGDRIAVDLDNPAAQIRNRPPDIGGLVTGVIRQIDEAVPGPAGIIAYRRAPAGTPTSDITNDMFVVLVLDERS